MGIVNGEFGKTIKKEVRILPVAKEFACLFSLQWWGGLFWLDELIGELIFDLIGEL